MLEPLICVLWLLSGMLQCTGYFKEESRYCIEGMRAGVSI